MTGVLGANPVPGMPSTNTGGCSGRCSNDGTAICFPSLLEVDPGSRPPQLGSVAGNLTQKHLGVRISVHRVRDNVATEASDRKYKSGGSPLPVADRRIVNTRNDDGELDPVQGAQGRRGQRGMRGSPGCSYSPICA